MPTSFIALTLVIVVSFGSFGIAIAQAKDAVPMALSTGSQSLNKENKGSLANDYYFQSWNCLTDF